jgi:uncharacterized membrane protein YsdA (DUF1294 family)
MKYLYFYLVIINAVSCLVMLIDKIKAKRKAWRIPEKTLLGICAIGGSLGGLIAMKLFRHKTLHPQFSIGIPVMLAVHVVLLVVLHAM